MSHSVLVNTPAWPSQWQLYHSYLKCDWDVWLRRQWVIRVIRRHRTPISECNLLTIEFIYKYLKFGIKKFWKPTTSDDLQWHRAGVQLLVCITESLSCLANQNSGGSYASFHKLKVKPVVDKLKDDCILCGCGSQLCSSRILSLSLTHPLSPLPISSLPYSSPLSLTHLFYLFLHLSSSCPPSMLKSTITILVPLQRIVLL